MKIQLAIQGGGAKLISLLAAARALQEVPDIEITRVIGTSADAMVGTFLAAGIDLEQFRRELEIGTGEKLSRSLSKAGSARFLRTMLTGTPVWKTDVLRRVITEALDRQSKAINMPLKTLNNVFDATGIDLRIVSADLRNPTPIIHRRDQDSLELVTHLLESAAIPFYFNTWGNGPVVDGGLVQNFPWEDLLDTQGSDYGPIIGISFVPSDRSAPTGRVDYAKALLETAMDASTERARNRLGADRVLSLPVEFDTFDFENGLNQNAVTAHFQEIKRIAADWFASRFGGSGLRILDDPWLSTSISTMEKLGKIHLGVHCLWLRKQR
jgi:predicted acylesterase/phospholipase RssA